MSLKQKTINRPDFLKRELYWVIQCVRYSADYCNTGSPQHLMFCHLNIIVFFMIFFSVYNAFCLCVCATGVNKGENSNRFST